IDVPAGSVFASAADVAKALGTAVAFKYLQQVYDALPPLIAHAVTINLAAGIHRPHPTNPGGGTLAAWSFNSKTVSPVGSLSFVGAAPSLWTPKPFVPTAIAITGTQVASGDPWVDVGGTPFTVPAWAATTAYVVGDRVLNNGNTYICRVAGTSAGAGGPSGSASNILDGTVRWDFVTTGTAYLKGHWAVFNTGQAAVIHDNTASRIFCTDFLSPTPTSILFIARPSTILRNSLNDTTGFGSFTSIQEATNNEIGIGLGNRINWQDIAHDPFILSSNAFVHSSGSWRPTRFLHDAETIHYLLPGSGADGNQISCVGAGRASVAATSFIFASRAIGGGPDLLLSADGPWSFTGCYFENSEDGFSFRGPAGSGTFQSSVFRSIGFFGGTNIFAGMNVDGYGARVSFLDQFQGGKFCEFRDHKASMPPLRFSLGGTTRSDNQHVIFKNNLAACVVVGPSGVLDVSASGASLGFNNGTGNGDVGIDIQGPGAVVSLNTGTNVTGANGDVKLAGVTQTYASIPATGSGNANAASAVRRA
ncbi:MAG TPA: carbohydrate-binding protein, partial [Vicinamibacterales bacterium]|nr:carbohydrate-binding protein [Vicinamibacterales bacterium]